MNSKLSDLINEFIDYKRKTGFVYNTAGFHLLKYSEYLSLHYPTEEFPSKESITSFLSTHADKPGSLYNAAAALRELSRYLISIGYPNAYVIPYKKVSLPTPVQPYLFTDTEIEKFFFECDNLPFNGHVPKRVVVLPAMYRLHYCCGLRCKETRTIKCENVHLQQCYIDILQSKGPKSRRIYISDELSQYLQIYDTTINSIFPDRTYFFPSREDTPYSPHQFEVNFLKIWYSAFPEKENDGVSVRAYDFRHHFAYANMNRWLKEGRDLNVMLPYLMQYMGHQDLESTLYYFHLVPDIYSTIIEKQSCFEDLLPEVKHYE